jgi:hypothetical protein
MPSNESGAERTQQAAADALPAAVYAQAAGEQPTIQMQSNLPLLVTGP